MNCIRAGISFLPFSSLVGCRLNVDNYCFMPDEKEQTDVSSTTVDEIHGSDEGGCEPKPEGKYYYDDAHGYQDFDPGSADQEIDDK